MYMLSPMLAHCFNLDTENEEIAQLLQISVGTSKSQLFKARKMLQENLRLMGITPRTKSRGQ